MASRFRRLKRDCTAVNEHVSLEQLTDLEERLQSILVDSDERARYLDFEQQRWHVRIYLDELDELKQTLTTKQGNLQTTEQRYRLYRVRISDDHTICFNASSRG
jgi:hypothetical protein